MVFYSISNNVGLDAVFSSGDGQTIFIRWFKAYPSVSTNKIGYNIYYSTEKENVFSEGVKYFSYDDSLEANIIDLNPGQEYFFSVRPVEYNSSSIDVNELTTAYDALKIYPSTILRSNITASSLIIPVIDVDGFPPTGLISVGIELMRYSSVNSLLNNLIISGIGDRGLFGTEARLHMVDGYDGYRVWDETIRFYLEKESKEFDRIYACQARFEYPNYAYTEEDGYYQVTKDLLTTDLSLSDESNIDFPMYDYSGYHRTDPLQLLTGICVGSYIGGEQGCIDEYGNVGITRGLSLQDQNNQRQEMLLRLTGREAILIKRMRTGIRCACYQPSAEYPDDRCDLCHGSGFAVGYEQYFNPRKSNGRIMIRFGPTEENVKMYEAGLESEFPIDCWSLVVPTIKTRDILVFFDQDGVNEEFRYEVTGGVIRNNTIDELMGVQKFKAVRIRKTDPAYQIRIFRDSSMFPSKLNTSIGSAMPAVPFHTHTIVLSEKITSTGQINQTTSVDQGHCHTCIDGVVQETLSHSHIIIL